MSKTEDHTQQLRRTIHLELIKVVIAASELHKEEIDELISHLERMKMTWFSRIFEGRHPSSPRRDASPTRPRSSSPVSPRNSHEHRTEWFRPDVVSPTNIILTAAATALVESMNH